MEAYQQNQERINMTSASTFTSTEQLGTGPNGFFLEASTAHTEEPYDSTQERARLVFPHTSIPYNYSLGDYIPVVFALNNTMGQSSEEEEETSHS